jgi:outer membrane receptor for ferrienterochelin and colicins
MKGRRLFLALSIALAVTVPAWAQPGGGTVSGSLVDETGAALPGANVQLIGPGANKFAVTGNDGRYTFTGVPAGTHKVTATLIGFGAETHTVEVSGTAAVEVPSTTLKITLPGEEVVVTASKSESSLVNAPATMSVVSNETIESSPAQNYGDLLRSVPGLNVIQMSARDINLTSRQGTSTLSNSQLALLDGRSIYLDFFGLILWDFVPSNPSDIKQIEVVRGPASAVWGANALTGVVNIITKTPRESPGGSAALTAGTFAREDGDSGEAYGASASYSAAPNDRWSYRAAGGYFSSDAYSRPTGRIPVSTHPLDASIRTGGGLYPTFENQGTRQPKADLRVDQELTGGGRVTYSGGFAGTEGIVHTGIGPFDLQPGSYLGYGRVGFAQGGFRAAAFVNALDGEAPNLLTRDASGRFIQLDFKTQTYDLDAGYTHLVAGRHILSYGGNARRNNFDITIAPQSEDRTELGAYFQDEIFFDKFRLSLGGRVDKFGNIDDPIFSPRVTAIFKPTPAHALRASFNRAFRSPSTINNFLDVTFAQPIDLSAFAAIPGLPAPLVAFFSVPFNLQVRAVGSDIDDPSFAGRDRPGLKEESLTAYEVAYTGTLGGRTTVGAAFYINDTDDNINFLASPGPGPFQVPFYTPQAPPPGFPAITVGPPFSPVPLPLASFIVAALQQRGILLPRNLTYMNIGKIRNKGVELSVDHTFDRNWSAFANYSWQAEPEPLDDVGSPERYPTSEISLAPANRVNAGVGFNNDRFVGSGSVNWTDEAFWVDVLDASTHGPSDAFTMVNASFGVKWNDGRVVTSLKGTNLLNQSIQQHVFGDILKRSLMAELRVKF